MLKEKVSNTKVENDRKFPVKTRKLKEKRKMKKKSVYLEFFPFAIITFLVFYNCELMMQCSSILYWRKTPYARRLQNAISGNYYCFTVKLLFSSS